MNSAKDSIFGPTPREIGAFLFVAVSIFSARRAIIVLVEIGLICLTVFRYLIDPGIIPKP